MPMFVLPDPGEGLVEGEIVTWLVKVGDEVKINDIVVEVETAKSLVELPIPYDGVVRALLAAEGDTVEVGAAIIDIDNGSDPAHLPSPGASGEEEISLLTTTDLGSFAGSPLRDKFFRATGNQEPPPGQATSTHTETNGANLVGYGPAAGATVPRRRKNTESKTAQVAAVRPKAAPAVRRHAKDLGVGLGNVHPTGAQNVVTRQDVDAFAAALKSPRPSTKHGPTAAGPAIAWPRPAACEPRETRVVVKGVRKLTANAMVSSAFTAPHVTEFITVDATATMDLVDRLKGDPEFFGLRVSPLLLLAKAVTIAVRRNPGVNAAWDETAGEIVQKHYLNLGIAAATPRGLIVPNIKDADQLNLPQLASEMQDLLTTAKAGRAQLSQMTGGTITITNVGVFGVDTGTPIINRGESAIVCFGAVRRQPWVVTGADGSESIEPRWVTQLAVSFDHRLIDGALGSHFLADIAALLHDPTRALVWV